VISDAAPTIDEMTPPTKPAADRSTAVENSKKRADRRADRYGT
jgi:hypothetical protein